MCSAPWTASWSKHFIPSWAEHRWINTNHKNKTKKTKRICWHQWRGRSLFNRERRKSAEICWTTDYLITNITSFPDWTWNVMAPLILAHFNLGWRILGMTLQETWTMIRYFRHLYHSSGLYVTILHPYQTELNPHVFVDIACYLKPLNRPVCVLSLSLPGPNLQQIIMKQYFNPPDLDSFFGAIESPRLENIFYKSKPRYFKRTSSAVWHSPPAGK